MLGMKKSDTPVPIESYADYLSKASKFNMTAGKLVLTDDFLQLEPDLFLFYDIHIDTIASERLVNSLNDHELTGLNIREYSKI